MAARHVRRQTVADHDDRVTRGLAEGVQRLGENPRVGLGRSDFGRDDHRLEELLQRKALDPSPLDGSHPVADQSERGALRELGEHRDGVRKQPAMAGEPRRKDIGEKLDIGIDALAAGQLYKALHPDLVRSQLASLDEGPQAAVDGLVGLEQLSCVVAFQRRRDVGEGGHFGRVGIEKCVIEVEEHDRVGHGRRPT